MELTEIPIFSFSAQIKLETVKYDRETEVLQPTLKSPYCHPPSHLSLRGPAKTPSLCVASLLWSLWREPPLLRCLGTLGYSFIEQGQQNRKQAVHIQKAPRSGKRRLFSTSIPASESLPQTQIISLCLSFTFYKVGIIIAIPPYFLSRLWVEIIAYVSPGEERLKSKHHYCSLFSANSLQGNHSFLLLY